MVLMVAAVLFGCEARTRYKVFGPFFDGVPNPDETAPSADRNKSIGARAAVDANETKKKQYVEHGPYAAKLCEGCHQRGTNKLLMPIESLCLYCHAVTSGKKRIHGPIASGGCKICHDPHSSSNRFLLVSDSKEFCLYCHDKNEIATREVHQGMSTECITCHDAHGSDNEFLLK
jgi:predicted CXXCH cytochrome family protein